MRKKAKKKYLEIAFNCSPYLVVYIYLLKPSVPYLLRNRLSKAFSNSYSTLSGPMSPSICSKNVKVGCFGFNCPLRQYFSLYRAVSQREGEIEEKRVDESKNVQTTPTRTYYKCSRPLPYCKPNCKTPRH